MKFQKIVVAGVLVICVLGLRVGYGETAQGRPETVRGYVLDSACGFIKDLKKPVSRECALACAKAGSPLVILADGGTIYLAISDSMPAIGQNKRLMKFAGQRVTAKGKVFDKGGSHAIVIERIEAVSETARGSAIESR